MVRQKHYGRCTWHRKTIHLPAARKQRGITGGGQSQDIPFKGIPHFLMTHFLS
jgi:hypothetical protein